jgi:hypothetical protein
MAWRMKNRSLLLADCRRCRIRDEIAPASQTRLKYRESRESAFGLTRHVISNEPHRDNRTPGLAQVLSSEKTPGTDNPREKDVLSLAN